VSSRADEVNLVGINDPEWSPWESGRTSRPVGLVTLVCLPEFRLLIADSDRWMVTLLVEGGPNRCE